MVSAKYRKIRGLRCGLRPGRGLPLRDLRLGILHTHRAAIFGSSSQVEEVRPFQPDGFLAILFFPGILRQSNR
jgi:hypothetical protein